MVGFSHVAESRKPSLWLLRKQLKRFMESAAVTSGLFYCIELRSVDAALLCCIARSNKLPASFAESSEMTW
jgi:hypothetical protein